MEFRILDRLEVIEQGRNLPLGGARQRALLAVLLIHRRRRVSMDELIDALWGESPPPTASKTIQVYVSRLRKALGDGVLETQDRGYRLAADAADVDADRFAALAQEGRAALESGDPGRAADLLHSALELWRGPPLCEFVYEPFARDEIERLEAERLAALEVRLAAELGMGRGPDLVPEIEQLVTQHPLREGLAASLMLALYRSGRQADALAVYRATRRRLVDELGLEPGLELRELERRILDHDPTLSPRRVAPRLIPRALPRRALGALALTIAAITAAALTLGAGATPPHRPALHDLDGLLTLDATSGKVLGATPVAGAPAAVGTAGGAVWVAAPDAGIVAKVDAVSGNAVDRIPLGGEPGTIIAGDGAVWAASAIGATVRRIDPTTDAVTQTITLPDSDPSAVAMGGGRLWVADAVARKVFEIDAASGALSGTAALRVRPSAVAIAAGALWVAGYDSGTVEKLDPASHRVLAEVRVGGGPTALAFTPGAMWVANSLDSSVSRIDPVRDVVTATIAVGSGPSSIVSAGGSVWVASRYAREVSRIDPADNRLVRVVNVGGSPTALTSGAGRLWVGITADDRSHRGGTLTIITHANRASPNGLGPAWTDPGLYDAAFPPQFIGLAYDSLVTFQHSDGPSGQQLVPDLAVAIPRASADATAYAFRIRPRIRYSDGRLVRAGDFRRAIERLFRLHSPGAPLFAGLVGADRCRRAAGVCDLSRGVVTDETRGVVTFHLTRPDPQFLYKLTEQGYSAPVPPGTPDAEPEGRRVPGTGPYTIVDAEPQQIRFARNPYFREWAHAAQPTGNPDAIVWRNVRSADAGVAAVQRGDADWYYGLIPADRYRRIRVSDPATLHISPTFGIEFLPLNTHRPPFDDVRVRRALNFAIDRHHIAELYGGADFASPACQPLTPGLSGYRRYCPYTRRPATGGAWSAADLAKARRLIRASGTQGQRIDVWGPSDEDYTPPTVSGYIASVLRRLGYRVTLHVVPFASISPAMRRGFQLSVDGDWVAEYPDPSAYLPQFFGCHGGTSNSYVCEPALDRAMGRASSLEVRDPAAAGRLWSQIDHRLTDDAAWVPTVNEREVEVTSPRLHHYQYNPVWGFLVDQSWVH